MLPLSDADREPALRALTPIRTPLVRLSGYGWRRLFVKDETRQVSGAFKYRGNVRRLARLAKGTPLTTASTGNHAAGLAIAAAHLGMPLTVYAPRQTPEAKLSRILDGGAELIPVDGDYDDCEKCARKDAARRDAVFVHSFDDPLVIEGHRALFSEAAAQAEPADVAFVPVGGGGLVTAGIHEWGRTSTQIIGVEYETAPAMKRSLAADRRVILNNAIGMPEGLLVRQVGSHAFAACRRYELQVETVGEGELMTAMRMLWAEAGIRAEGAGAAALAAALAAPRSSAVALCVVSGGNIDDSLWRRCVGLSSMPR